MLAPLVAFRPVDTPLRSAYLTTLLGLCLLVDQALSIDLQFIVLFGTPANYFQNSVVSVWSH